MTTLLAGAAGAAARARAGRRCRAACTGAGGASASALSENLMTVRLFERFRARGRRISTGFLNSPEFCSCSREVGDRGERHRAAVDLHRECRSASARVSHRPSAALRLTVSSRVTGARFASRRRSISAEPLGQLGSCARWRDRRASRRSFRRDELGLGVDDRVLHGRALAAADSHHQPPTPAAATSSSARPISAERCSRGSHSLGGADAGRAIGEQIDFDHRSLSCRIARPTATA